MADGEERVASGRVDSSRRRKHRVRLGTDINSAEIYTGEQEKLSEGHDSRAEDGG